MSRNLTFSIIGILSAVLAYVFYPSMPELAQLIITERLPRDFTRLLQNSDLVAFAGIVSLFGLSFFLLYLIFPVSYVWYHLIAAKRIIEKLPVIGSATKRTNKKTFLSKLKGLGFIEHLANSYAPYLIQGPEVEVKAESLKNIRIIKKAANSNKNQKHTITPVRASVPSDVIFNVDSLVNDNLFLGFFAIFARLMVGAGIVCIGISLVSYSFVQGSGDVTLLSALQPGLTACLYFLVSAIIIAGITRLLVLTLHQNANRLARMINGLFHQNEWQQDISTIQTHITSNAAADQFESVLHNSLDKPMKDIAKAVKALSVDQEKKLDKILSNTLTSFAENMERKSGTDVASLNKTLKDTANTADQMKKHFTEANSQFSNQMDKQMIAISKHLADMQKVLGNSEKTTQKGAEKIVSTLATEVDATYERLGKFFEVSLNKLEEKHKSLEKAVNDKNGILQDLHSSAKDLGTISNASGILLERFILLSTELDIVLKHIQENGLVQGNGSAKKRDKLKLAVLKLKKSNKDRISELPDM